jgi:Uma2 family endonuclease
VRILPDVVREPDIFVLPPEEVPKAKGTPLDVRPALVVEVMSPSTRTIDLKEKVEDYALAQIPEYWAVDIEKRELLIHRLEGKMFTVERLTSGKAESRAVPGFWVEAGWLFQEPLPPVGESLGAVLH